ncbi:MAG: hypothetical protein KKA84_16095 [Bacteroidetes bacterium]|nr:hypothetical protein [Bacteroidota bacterium]
MILTNVLVIILVLSVTTLCIFAIVYINKIFKQIETVSKDIRHLTENAIPILRNMDELTRRTNRIVSDLEWYWIEIDLSIKTLRDKIPDSGPRKLLRTPRHIISLIKKLSTIAEGVFSVWRKYKDQ